MEQTILNYKEGDIMQNHSINSLAIIVISSLLLSACSMSDWWNGYYSDRMNANRYIKERAEYYANEPDDKRVVRKQNIIICSSGIKNINNEYRSSYLYMKCMRDRGTPEFGF